MSEPTWLERHPDFVGLVLKQMNEARELSNKHAEARIRLAQLLTIRRRELEDLMSDDVMRSVRESEQNSFLPRKKEQA